MNFKALVLVSTLLFSGHALANVKPDWVTGTDFDGDKRPEVIFVGNLADVVFNDRGEILGWFVKSVVGTQFVDMQQTPPNITRLQSQLPNSLLSGQKSFVVATKSKDPIQTQTPILDKVGDPNRPNRFTAQFAYTQGTVQVTKKVTIDPNKFTLTADINVKGQTDYDLSFSGVGGSTAAQIQANPKHSPSVVFNGNVDNIEYVAIQKDGSWWNPMDSASLIVQPVGQSQVSVDLIPGSTFQQFKLKASGSAQFHIYGGRKELVRLQLEGYHNLPGVFEPNIWGRLSQGLIWLMQTVHGFVGSWFLTILLITVLLRLVLWPLMHRQYLSTAEMQFVQPQLKELNEKYKDNPERRQQETIQLYKEHKINPAAGCLPAIVQIPIWFVMWRVPYYYEFNEGFLWLPDLSLPDPFWVLPILYVAVNVLNLWISTRKTPEMFRQQVLIYLVFAYIALQFPAGAAIYFVFSTLIGVVQYLVINRRIALHMETRNVSRVTAK